jgi:glutaredoxin 1
VYTIIGREDCFWCNAAIELLDEPYVYYDYTSLPVLSLLMKKCEMKTVPQIWDGDNYIGGYVELEAYLKDKESEL